MKIFNCVVQYDLYVVAENAQEAMAAALGIISGGEPANDTTTYMVGHLRDIRNEWRDQLPFVAPSVSEKDFKPYAGKTTQQVYEALYTKG